MPYIYKITNDINGKIYIGKTLSTIKKRWKEHLRDCKKDRCEKRPLYSAMRKYGVEHFHIEQVEECSFSELSEKEKYWIEYYGSFKEGYNATLGGDGTAYCDYDLIYSLWNKGLNLKEIANKLNYCEETCRKALYAYNVSKDDIKEQAVMKLKRGVIQRDKDDNIVGIYPSIAEAYKAINKRRSSHIQEVCNGKRKIAYGYKWEFI